MEAAVKLINPSTSLEDSQRRWTKLAICLRGRKHATCVINEDSGIHLVKIPVADYDRYAQTRATHTPSVVAQRMLDFTVRDVAPKPITKGALEILERVVSGDIPEQDVEFKDEPIEAPVEKRINGDAKPRSNLLAQICSELKIEGTAARRKLRKAGLHAPYENEKEIRAALK